MKHPEGSSAGRDRTLWLVAAVALIGLGQVLLAGRSQGALAEFWLAVALAWACAASLWEFKGDRWASRWWIAPAAALIAASLIELAPAHYQTAHRIAPLAAGIGLALLRGPREIRRQARALSMLLCPLLLPAPRLARELIDLCPPTAVATGLALKAAGIPVARTGIELRLPSSTMLVFQGCSGLDQIVALLFVALFAIFLFDTGRAAKVWLLASAALVGFACNAVRIAALAVLADRGQMQRFAAWHDGALSPLCTVGAVALALAIWLPLLRRQVSAAA